MAGLLRPDDVLYWLLYFEFGDCFEECDHDTGPPFDEILREAIRTISEPCGMLIKITAASAKARDEPFEIVLGGRRDDTPRSMDWRDLLPGIIGSFVGVMGWLLVGLYIQRRQFVRQARNAAKAVYFELDVNRAAIDVARQHGLFANLDRTSFERLLPELATLLSAPDLRIVVDAYMTHAGYGQLASRGELPADVRRAALSTFLGVHGRALEKLQQCAFTTAEAHAIVTKPHEPDAADARESIVRTAP